MLERQEAQLSQRNRATLYDSRNLVNCSTAVRKSYMKRLSRMTSKVILCQRNCRYSIGHISLPISALLALHHRTYGTRSHLAPTTLDSRAYGAYSVCACGPLVPNFRSALLLRPASQMCTIGSDLQRQSDGARSASPWARAALP